jgi:hypothetical protein
VPSTPASIAQTWLELAAENRGTHRFELSYAAFRSILNGVALSPSELAEQTTLGQAEALDLIETMVDEGRLRLDDSKSHIVAAAGLSLTESRHTLTMNGHRFGVWCALDAVGIPAGLDLDATIESECLDTGEPVRIEIQGGRISSQSPEDVLISLVPASVATSVFDTL